MVDIKANINYEDFSKLDVRVGEITEAEKVDGSEKLIKMKVNFGELGERQIIAGIQKWYQPNDLVGMKTTFVINMEPRKMLGIESQGMLFALGLSDDQKPVFLIPSEEVQNGEGAR